MDELSVKCLLYANDKVILAPSKCELQEMAKARLNVIYLQKVRKFVYLDSLFIAKRIAVYYFPVINQINCFIKYTDFRSRLHPRGPNSKREASRVYSGYCVRVDQVPYKYAPSSLFKTKAGPSLGSRLEEKTLVKPSWRFMVVEQVESRQWVTVQRMKLCRPELPADDAVRFSRVSILRHCNVSVANFTSAEFHALYCTCCMSFYVASDRL
ncbi:hypothetical protein EVAR_77585_1 [Eumeta japonica]|uniref:Reverse transcriptase domain-containing protein n=1 Tax=Eumeta variegata TaxID=151549 RepID=A0A4C1T6Y8_EUMVA|nr:hypothetical protein EVAR_77585_1 [Eumeta japonica]